MYQLYNRENVNKFTCVDEQTKVTIVPKINANRLSVVDL